MSNRPLSWSATMAMKPFYLKTAVSSRNGRFFATLLRLIFRGDEPAGALRGSPTPWSAISRGAHPVVSQIFCLNFDAIDPGRSTAPQPSPSRPKRSSQAIPRDRQFVIPRDRQFVGTTRDQFPGTDNLLALEMSQFPAGNSQVYSQLTGNSQNSQVYSQGQTICWHWKCRA